MARVSAEQIEFLTEFMEKNRELALGRVLRGNEGREASKRMWNELAISMNALGVNGSVKSGKAWRLMVMKLYKLDASPPVRTVLMVADLLKVPLEKIDIDLIEKKEHLQPDYLKMNPLHTIPTFQDGDFVLHDSHAIITYFAQAYGKDDTLYPKDIKQRALVDQKLFFDATILFTRMRNVTYAAFFEGQRTVSEKQKNDIEEAYSFMEAFLAKNKWLAGNNMTLADIAAIATISSAVYILSIDTKKFPKLSAWKTEMEKQTFYKNANEAGVKTLGNMIKSVLG